MILKRPKNPTGQSRSHITDHKYDPETRTLDITFRNGGTYRYADVPNDVYSDFTKAASQGRFHHKYIVGRHSYTKL